MEAAAVSRRVPAGEKASVNGRVSRVLVRRLRTCAFYSSYIGVRVKYFTSATLTNPQPHSQIMPVQPSVYTTKTAFLSKQVRNLSALPPPPPNWRENLPPPDEHGDLSDAVVQQVLYKLSAVARKHNNAVYNAQTLRHVAEQIDSLYRRGREPVDGEPDEQTEVLRAGVDLREKEYVLVDRRTARADWLQQY